MKCKVTVFTPNADVTQRVPHECVLELGHAEAHEFHINGKKLIVDESKPGMRLDHGQWVTVPVRSKEEA